jgi:hypothetical protein
MRSGCTIILRLLLLLLQPALKKVARQSRGFSGEKHLCAAHVAAMVKAGTV